MRILITGGLGFIGSHFVKWLSSNTNHDLEIIDNLSFSTRENLPIDLGPRCRLLAGDITDYSMVNGLFKNKPFDIVYHFGAISSLPECQSDPIRAFKVNVEATANLLEQCRLTGIAKFVFASSNSIYEHNNEMLPHRETDKLSPLLIYPLTKKFSEELCSSYSFNYGLNTVCLRFSNIYGVGQDKNRKCPALTGYILDCLLRNENPILHGDGTQKRDYLYIDDLIDFLIAELNEDIIDSGSSLDTILNISSNIWISVQEIYELFAWKLGKYIDKPFFIDKTDLSSLKWTCPPIYRPAEQIWEKYPILTEGVYPIDEYVIESEVNKDTLTSNLNACTQFYWFPKVSMEEGIQRMVEVYK